MRAVRFACFAEASRLSCACAGGSSLFLLLAQASGLDRHDLSESSSNAWDVTWKTAKGRSWADINDEQSDRFHYDTLRTDVGENVQVVVTTLNGKITTVSVNPNCFVAGAKSASVRQNKYSG